MMSSKVTIYLDMLGALMEDRVVIDVYGTFIITVPWSRIRDRCTYVGKQPMYPNNISGVAMARYSASMEERETIFCFLLFQELRGLPRKTQSSVVDLRSTRSPAKSASEKAQSLRDDVGEYRRL